MACSFPLPLGSGKQIKAGSRAWIPSREVDQEEVVVARQAEDPFWSSRQPGKPSQGGHDEDAYQQCSVESAHQHGRDQTEPRLKSVIASLRAQRPEPRHPAKAK